MTVECPDLRHVLAAAVDARVPDRARAAWRGGGTTGSDRDMLLARFAGAGRRLGPAPVRLTPAELGAVDPTLAGGIEGRPLHELGRLVLMLDALAAAPTDEHPALVEEVYRQGSLEEKVALLRALPWLPGAGRFLSVAAEGVRTNAGAILEAIACDNPYPSQHFTQAAWNQLVMKAVFCGLPLARLMGLERRRNPELARMAADFAAERRAAGRPVPEDLARIV